MIQSFVNLNIQRIAKYPKIQFEQINMGEKFEWNWRWLFDWQYSAAEYRQQDDEGWFQRE